ncbi:MAG: hypothetical protein HDQ87_01730 [Clostridia bacterium]|nr:hypothetical protein [Clostridia bacterium]
MSNTIRIGKPYLESTSESVRLCAPIVFQGENEIIWFSVKPEYGDYLTDDRSDAFVAGILTTALRDGTDIICETPVTRRLLYQLNHYLIPMMSLNMPSAFSPVKVHAAPTDEMLPCAGAVGTGWTGGVDSMFTLMQNLQAEEPTRQLTHLLITSNGALEGEDNTALLNRLVQNARSGIAAETGLKVIGVNTNLQDIRSEPFLSVAAFRHSAVTLALQKLFGALLWSSAYEFSRFAFDADNCFYYELVVYSSFETDTTVLYSAGGAYSRVQKLEALSDYPLAWKYLHPCIEVEGSNCGRCGKCVRTEAALYGLGKLDKFSEVFDVNAFERDRNWYLAQILANKHSQHYGEALVLIQQRGIELPLEAVRLARSLKAAKDVVLRNKEWLSRKLRGE